MSARSRQRKLVKQARERVARRSAEQSRESRVPPRQLGEAEGVRYDPVWGDRVPQDGYEDREAGSQNSGIMADFAVVHAANLSEVVTCSTEHERACETHAAVEQEHAAAESDQAELAKELPDSRLAARFAGLLSHLAVWAIILVAGASDYVLTLAAVELMGIDPWSTKILAATIGILFLIGSHLVGRMIAHREFEHPEGWAAKHSGAIVILVLLVSIGAMAPMGALLRSSSTLVEQAERGGQLVTSTGVGFWTVFLFFSILATMLNAFALSLGYFTGHPIVEALGGAQRRTRRLAARLRSTGRAVPKTKAARDAANSQARAWIPICTASVRKIWRQHRTNVIAYHAGIVAGAADDETRAAMSHAAYLDAVDPEAQSWFEEDLKTLEDASAALEIIVRHYGPLPAIETDGETGTQPAVGENEEAELPVPDHGGNGSGDPAHISPELLSA